MVDPRVGRLVTMSDASKAARKPETYFAIRRHRWQGHPEHPFPQPVTTVAGHDVYDLQELLVWDAARLQRDALTRAAHKTKPKEA